MYFGPFFGRSSAKIGTIQRRLAWPLRKDDTHKSRMYHFFCSALHFLDVFENVLYFVYHDTITTFCFASTLISQCCD